MYASWTHACFESHTPLVNGCIDDVVFNTAPNIQQTLSQFVNISNLCLVDALLLCSTDFVITGLRSGLFAGHYSGEIKSGDEHGVMEHCPAETRTHSLISAHGNNFCVAVINTVYFHPRLYKKNNSVQPSFETPTDIMTVSLNVERVYARDVAMHARVAFGRQTIWTHAVNLSA